MEEGAMKRAKHDETSRRKSDYRQKDSQISELTTK
jgi:hypothetical protein